MSILRKLFGSRTKYETTLNKSDLLMARDEIADFHKTLNAQAEAEGGAYYFKNEYVATWEAFRDNPNIENARALLEVAPELLRYFEDCSPGGDLYATNSYLRKSKLNAPPQLTSDELTLFVLISHDLHNPQALQALKELAEEREVDFEKVLRLVKGANLPPPLFESFKHSLKN
jgi:hypothetical protein